MERELVHLKANQGLCMNSFPLLSSHNSTQKQENNKLKYFFFLKNGVRSRNLRKFHLEGEERERDVRARLSSHSTRETRFHLVLLKSHLSRAMAMFKTLSFLFVLCFEIHGTVGVNFTFSFDGFVKSQNKSVALFGDSKLVNDSSSIQLTDSVSGSVGRVFYRKPINLFQGKERNSVIFSTYFSFSMPNEIGDVLAFVMVPSTLDLNLFGKRDNSSTALGFLLQYAKNETVVAFDFDISKRGNRASILLGRPESAKIRNLSFVGDLMMNNGGTLSCMIDYEASSKRMMVRFRKYGSIKLFDPFFSFSVDLAKLWKGNEVVVGLSSANGNSSKAHFLHSWSFETRHLHPTWVHSVPLEQNEGLKANISTEEEEGRERRECIWKLLGALVLGAVCGAIGSMSALCLWTICRDRRSMAVVPEECANEQGKK